MRVAFIVLATFAVSLALDLAGASGVEAASGHASDRTTVAAGDIRIGDLLQATRDVSLDEAVIAEGSKISVSGKRSASGRVLLDVALADGHVVRGVPLAEIRKSFRRVDP